MSKLFYKVRDQNALFLYAGKWNEYQATENSNFANLYFPDKMGEKKEYFDEKGGDNTQHLTFTFFDNIDIKIYFTEHCKIITECLRLESTSGILFSRKLTLAFSRICLEEFYGIKLWKKEWPKKAERYSRITSFWLKSSPPQWIERQKCQEVCHE